MFQKDYDLPPTTFRPPWPPDPTTNRLTSLPSTTFTQPPATNLPEFVENHAQSFELPHSISARFSCSGDTHGREPPPANSPHPDDPNHCHNSSSKPPNRSKLHISCPPALPPETQPFSSTSGGFGDTHGRGPLPGNSPCLDDHSHAFNSSCNATNRSKFSFKVPPL
ncbi:Hypothetical predicted protein [Olea europaea subsp. europaea]|uniref:Uncharacterized protein n=1 Tax=Olea europaea subsp. europaea TaxID=158383 RepID=A0A8S0TLR7_OLEEU|nr:Hypothetical predicted protein [Olea europaea subsp. europaea]